MPPRNFIAWFAVLAALLAPALVGCQPPWAWGPLFAVVFGAAVLLIAADLLLPAGRRCLDRVSCAPCCWFVLAGFGALAWACAIHGYDIAAGPEQERWPAFAPRTLCFAFLFPAGFLLGLPLGMNGRRLRKLFGWVTSAGAVYAAIGLMEWLRLGPRKILDWTTSPERPAGTYMNPNLFAVLLAMALSCSMGLFLLHFFAGKKLVSRRARARRKIFLFVCAIATAIIAAGIVVTLSRMTLLCVSAGIGVAVMIYMQKNAQYSRRRIPVVAMFITFVLISAASVALALTFSGHSLSNRLETLTHSADTGSRLAAMRTSCGLLLRKPLIGWGPGTFETAFRPAQPLDLPQRWIEVHNDWLQIAVELGVVGAAAVFAAALAWAILWWRGLRPSHLATYWPLLLAGGLAIFVPLACSLGDFPLREPANALLFALLAGAIAGKVQSPKSLWKHDVSGKSGTVKTAAIGALLAAAFSGSGFYAARAGYAAASTPWFGCTIPPIAADTQGYSSALAILPGDPEFLVLCAQSEIARLHSLSGDSRNETRNTLNAHIATLKSLTPADFAPYSLQARAYAEDAEFLQAADLMDQAVRLAPAYRELRSDACFFRLCHVRARQLPPFSAERSRHFEAALAHLRVLIALDPALERPWVEWLQQCGFLPDEIVQLWPSGQPRYAITRARIWMNAERWDMGETEIKNAPAVSTDPWVLAIRGRLALMRGESAGALANWGKALERMNPADGDLQDWFGTIFNGIPTKSAVAVADALPAVLAKSSPRLAIVLAQRMQRQELWPQAEQLMATLAEVHPNAEGYRCWTEIALARYDPQRASALAERASELGQHTAGWKEWLNTIRARCKAEERR